MSQTSLAHAADVPVGSLRNWEQGRRLPRVPTARRLARILNVSLDDLFRDIPDPKPKQKKKRK